MKQKIKKLCKILNKFTLEEIITISQFDEKDIVGILNTLVEENCIKKISDSEYLYIPNVLIKSKITQNKKEQIQNETNIEISDDGERWVPIEEVARLTGFTKETIRRKCKNGTFVFKCTKSARYKYYLVNEKSIKDLIKTAEEKILNNIIKEFKKADSIDSIYM